MRFSLIPLTIIFVAILVSDYILNFVDFNDIISKYPVKFFVVYWAYYLSRLAYCVFYIGILVLALTKILLKLRNLITLSIAIFLTVFFAFVMVSAWPGYFLGSEYYVTYPVLERLFWELEMPYWDLLRLMYTVFYAVFLLLLFNSKILKLPRKIIFSVILLAGTANLVWVIEVIARGWRGLYWLEYIHAALFVIGILFLCWLVIINRNNTVNNHKRDMLFYGTLYTLLLLIFIVLFKILFKNVYDQYGLRYSFSKYWPRYIFIIAVQVSIIVIFNILVLKYEKAVISTKIVCLAVFSMILIPVYTFLSSYIVLNGNIENIFDSLSISLNWDFIRASYFDPIDWIKLGNIIFGFVIYECLFIAYIKQNDNIAVLDDSEMDPIIRIV
jgi:hypothetical protein